MRAFILAAVVGVMSLSSLAMTPAEGNAREWRSGGDTIAVARWRGGTNYRYWRGGSRYYYPRYWGGSYYAPSYYYTPSYDYYYNPGLYNSYYSPAYPSYVV